MAVSIHFASNHSDFFLRLPFIRYASLEQPLALSFVAGGAWA
ncbi:hypothetical protein [Stieleria tagensis]|nr:hypothetical protein [Stieleria tagensis]